MKYLILSLFLVGCNFNKQKNNNYEETLYNEMVLLCTNGCSSKNRIWTNRIILKNKEFLCDCER